MMHGYYRPVAGTGAVPKVSRVKWWTLMLSGPIAWFIPACVTVAVIGALSGFFYLPVPWLIAPFFTLALLMAVNRFFKSRQRQRGRLVLGYLENALRLNLPLPVFLLAARESEDRQAAGEISTLREHLMSGQTVALAVQESVPGISPEVIAEISAAEANGTLQRTLSRIEEEETQNFHIESASGGEEERGLFLRFYLPCVVTTMFFLMITWMIFVVPKFREIFKDFRMELPPVTDAIIRLSTFVGETSYIGPVLIVMLILAVMVLIGGQLQRMFTPAWPVPSFRWLYELIAWHAPFWRKMVLDDGMARLCRVLSEGVRAGKNLPEAMALAQTVPVNRFFRARVTRWQVLIVSGRPASVAAAEADMPALLVGFLAASENARRASNTGVAEMFEFVGRYYRGRVEHMALVLRAAAEPLSVIVIGLVVGTCVYGVILPVVHLINGTMGLTPEGTL